MKYLILGNGPAGVIAAETLRAEDPQGDIVMAGSEDAPPYSRMAIPYLLEGNIDESGTYLRKRAGHFDTLGVRQKAGRAVALDAAARRVLFHDGSHEDYDRLLIATGSHPVRPPIPGIDDKRIFTLRSLEDMDRITAATEAGYHFVGDQQHVVLPADPLYFRPVAARRHDHASGCLHRLTDKGADLVRPDAQNLLFQGAGGANTEILVVQPGAVRPGPGSHDVRHSGYGQAELWMAWRQPG